MPQLFTINILQYILTPPLRDHIGNLTLDLRDSWRADFQCLGDLTCTVSCSA